MLESQHVKPQPLAVSVIYHRRMSKWRGQHLRLQGFCKEMGAIFHRAPGNWMWMLR